MFTIAHISDLHLPPLPRVMPWALANKRLLGYLSWHDKRKAQHRIEVLTALREDLREAAPDHICVTGDVTNLGLADEFAAAAGWLARLGEPTSISVVPGNHDVCLPADEARMRDRLAQWMRGDDEVAGFPFVRRRGPVAFVGISSAVPTAPFLATGRVRAAQLARLGEALIELGGEGRLRVLLIHHPPQDGAVRARRRLNDAGALRRVLLEVGAELVLHGHAHTPLEATLPGPWDPIPVLGAASASAIGAHGRAPGHYHLLRLHQGEQSSQLDVEDRCFRPDSGRFGTVRHRKVALPGRFALQHGGCARSIFDLPGI